MNETSLALTLSTLSFMLTVIWGGPLLRVLRHFKIGKLIRVEEPGSHMIKMGTPTMGGVMIMLPVVLLTVLLNAASARRPGFPGPLGPAARLGDDRFRHPGRHRRLGRHPRAAGAAWECAPAPSSSFQIILGLLAPPWSCATCWMSPKCFGRAYWENHLAGRMSTSRWPTFIIVGVSNAVNFTDGLDGLAGLISRHCLCRLRRASPLLQGQSLPGAFLLHPGGRLVWFPVVQRPPGPAYSWAMPGRFRWAPPWAWWRLMTGQWLLLPLIAIIPVSEDLSVMIQIGYFKHDQGQAPFQDGPAPPTISNCWDGARPRWCSVSGWSAFYLPCLAWRLRWCESNEKLERSARANSGRRPAGAGPGAFPRPARRPGDLERPAPAEQMEAVRSRSRRHTCRSSWVLGGHPLSLLDEADLVCLSGGVPLTLPIVVEAQRRGMPLSNDSQIFMEAVPCRVIGITGSAGKTTTTTLVGRMADAAVTAPQQSLGRRQHRPAAHRTPG